MCLQAANAIYMYAHNECIYARSGLMASNHNNLQYRHNEWTHVRIRWTVHCIKVYIVS